MKLILKKFNKLDYKIYKLLIYGIKFCFLLILFASFILVKYQEIHNPKLFYIGFSLAKSTLFFIAFLIICSFSVDTIKNEIKK